MAKLSYKLRPTTGKGATIRLFFNYGSEKRFRYSTGFRVQNIKNWNEKTMRIKNVANEIDRYIVNEKLDDLQTKLNSAYKKLTIEENQIATDSFFKNFCDEYFNKKTSKVDTPSLLEFYDWYIQNYTNNPLPSTKHPLSHSTIKTYKSAYALIKRFNQEGNKVNYDSINFDFYNKYLDWLRENNYSENYIGNQIKTLKTMMNNSYDLGYHSNLEHRKRHFIKPNEVSFSIYLTESELADIENCDFTNFKPIKVNKSLRITPKLLNLSRDLFLISANTALRISDINRLSEKNILIEKNGRKQIQIITKKTNKPVSIPLNKTVLKIFEKYNGKPPKSIPPQHINYALKEIGKLAKINEVVIKKSTRGGIERIEQLKKYDLISSHTGRRSMITNAYLAGVPVSDIRMLSGHSSDRVFYHYLKLGGIERASKIGEHPFFQ